MTTSIEASIAPGSVAALNATTRASGKGSLDQSDFLKLLTAQLQTQDPFSPMDTQSMMTQMSQLSTNSGIAEMNASLKGMSTSLSALASQAGGTSDWIGHDALIAGDFVNRSTDGHYRGQIILDRTATGVTIDMLDANGLIVHSIEAGAGPAGPIAFAWDGQSGAESIVAGPLKVRVIARNGALSVPTTTSVWTPVTAVQSPAGTAPRLITPNGPIAPESVIALG